MPNCWKNPQWDIHVVSFGSRSLVQKGDDEWPKYRGTPKEISGGIAHLQRNMVYHVVYYIDWAYMYRQDIHKYTVYSVNERLSDT